MSGVRIEQHWAAVIFPGDKVLLTMPDRDITAQEAADIKDALRAQFPDVEFVLVGGVSGMAVQRRGA